MGAGFQMSLVQSKLKNDLLSAFNSMTDGDDGVFAKKVSKAVADYAKSGTITTVDAGTVSAGVFAGAGNGSISVDSSLCESVILAACKAMASMTSGGDTYLAAQMATGIDTMVKAGEVKTNVTGSAVPPTGSPIPLTGSAKGKLICVPSTLQSAFSAAFSAMMNMTENGDTYLAEQMASAITSYFQTGVVTTNGQGSLSGSVGVGAIA